MRTSFILVTGLFVAIGAALLVAQEPATPRIEVKPEISGTTADRDFLLAQIDTWRSGFRMECRHEIIRPERKARKPINVDENEAQVLIATLRSRSGRRVDGDPWTLIDVIRTANGETMLSSRSLAPGVAVFDNGDERIVQTTFGKNRLNYQTRAADLLSMLDPATLREAVAQAKVTRASDSTGRTRIAAIIDEPKLFHPLREKENSNHFAGWTPRKPEVMSLTLELTMAASGELERIRFDVQRSAPAHENTAFGNLVLKVDAENELVGEIEVIEDVREVEVVGGEKEKNDDKDEAAKKKNVKKKRAEVEPAEPVAVLQGFALADPNDVEERKNPKIVPSHRDVYTLTPARKKSRRQTKLLRDMRRATGM